MPIPRHRFLPLCYTGTDNLIEERINDKRGKTATESHYFYYTDLLLLQRSEELFLQKGIKFKDVDVSKDPAAARDMVRRSGQQGVPVIDIGGKIVVGFDQPKINQLLGIK